MRIHLRVQVVNVGMNELPDCCAKEFPETSEVRARSDDIVVVEFLAGLPCKRQINPQSLTGRIPLVEEGTPAKPLQSKSAQTLVERVTAAL